MAVLHQQAPSLETDIFEGRHGDRAKMVYDGESLTKGPSWMPEQAVSFPTAQEKKEKGTDGVDTDKICNPPNQGPSEDLQSVSLNPVDETLDPSKDSQSRTPPEKGKQEEGSRLADMPQLQGAQNLLYEQLQGMKAALEAELRERQKEVKDTKRKREDLGVELFGFQQQLRGIFQSLDEGDNRAAQLKLLNDLVQKNLAAKMQDVADTQSTVISCLNEVDEGHDELERLSALVRQSEDFYHEKRSQVAVTKRETYAADEALQQSEKSKDDQDRLVIHLERQISIQKSRLAKQEREKCVEEVKSSKIQEAVQEVAANIQQVNMEAEAKLQLWKSGIAELNRKDEQLQEKQAKVAKLEETIRALDMEVTGIKRSSSSVNSSRLKLVELLNRIQDASKQTAQKLEQNQAEQKVLEEKRLALSTSIEEGQSQLTSAKAENRKMKDVSNQLDRDTEKSSKLIQNKKVEVLRKLEEATLAKKGSQKIAYEMKALQKEADLEETANADLVKNLNTLKAKCDKQQVGIDRDTESMSFLQSQIEELERDVSEGEAASKKRNDLIEQRLREIATNNQKISNIAASRGSEPLEGPLQTTISHLREDLQKSKAGNQLLQRQWITCQRELIDLQTTSSANSKLLQNKETEAAILAQRAKRLLHLRQQTEAELKDLSKFREQQRMRLEACNAKIGSQDVELAMLEESRAALHQTAAAKKLEMDGAKREVQVQIESCEAQKEGLMHQLVGAQSKVGELGIKLQLSTEMHAKLLADRPDASPKFAAEKRIQRLDSQQTEVSKAQRKLVEEIELAIRKRDSLLLRGQATALKLQPTAVEASEAAGRHRIAVELQKAHYKINKKISAASKTLADLQTSQKDLAVSESAARQQHKALSQAIIVLQQDSKRSSQQRTQDMLRTSYLQKKAKHLEKTSQGQPRALPADTVIAERLALEAAQTEKLVAAIEASGQSQSAALQNLLLEADAVQVLHRSI